MWRPNAFRFFSSAARRGRTEMKAQAGRPSPYLREVYRTKKGIKVSPWQLSLVCRLVRRMTVPEAIGNLTYNKKRMAKTILKEINGACHQAKQAYNLAPEELEVAEIFATQGTRMKHMIYHGKGRFGVGAMKWAHLNLTLREVGPR